ncbi:TetR family transcriptional regulator [Leucobacter zeae]|nr:TetR family transcriptional regulator [Leucobacter zeae]
MASAERRTRAGAKPRLDAETIIEVALEVAAGTNAIVLPAKELGIRLGVDPTAIYRHFRNKAHLMEALLDALTLRSLDAVTAPDEQWRERLRQLAESTLVEFCRHPSVAAEAMVLTTHGPGELGAIEIMLDAFTRAGLPPEEVVRHYALFASQVLSTASGIAIGRAENRERPDAEEELEFSPWLDGPILADPRTYPRIAEFNRQLGDLDDRAIFHLGVESVIQSAERTAARGADV